MSSARSLPNIKTSPLLRRGVNPLLQTTPRISKDLRRCLIFKRDSKDNRCFTTPIPSFLCQNGYLNKYGALLPKSIVNTNNNEKVDHSSKISVREWIPENFKFDSPGFSRAFNEFEFSSPVQHSPDCIHPSPSKRPIYKTDGKDLFLGRGSFGDVSLCKYKSHNFALKIVDRAVSTHIGERNMLGIRHAHIVTVFRVTEAFQQVFVCMEFAGHYNLQYVLDNKTDLDFKSKLSFAQQIASGLNHCHKNKIVHGDVKPANVIISTSGECKLGDFGLSMKAENLKANCKGKFIGTAAYAAPEVLQGKGISTAADIYSFGITLWQIYTNEVPFAGEHPHIIIYKVGSKNTRPSFNENESNNDYIALVKRCWLRHPHNRPISAEVLKELKKQLREMVHQNGRR